MGDRRRRRAAGEAELLHKEPEIKSPVTRQNNAVNPSRSSTRNQRPWPKYDVAIRPSNRWLVRKLPRNAELAMVLPDRIELSALPYPGRHGQSAPRRQLF